MMRPIRIVLILGMLGAGVLSLPLLGGCMQRSIHSRSEARPNPIDDFTLGLVVRAPMGAQDPAIRSARYIIEPGGVFRASFGDGSDGLTYPPMTRRLNAESVAAIRDRVLKLDPGSLGWERIGLPRYARSHIEDQPEGIIVEIRRSVVYEAWLAPIGSAEARGLADELGGLAWIGQATAIDESEASGLVDE